jgi:ADP-ribosylglycohydrolase
MSHQKILGTLIGVVVGDLLGEQVEGVKNPGIITKFAKNARYTDDTEMTLITVQHLLTFQTVKPISLIIEYASNAHGNRKYGGNAFKTLNRIKTNPNKWKSAYKEFLDEGSWGNGCLMRISPIALFNLEKSPDVLLQHLRDCLIGTHSNEEALQCSFEYCLIIRDLYQQDPKVPLNATTFIERVIERNHNQRLTDKCKMIHEQIVKTDKVNKYGNLNGFINEELVEHSIRASDTLAMVLAVFTYNLKYLQWSTSALLPIVISMGGDTDTNAAILGSLLGALYGLDWIDKDWFDNIEDKQKILHMFNQFVEMVEKVDPVSKLET